MRLKNAATAVAVALALGAASAQTPPDAQEQIRLAQEFQRKAQAAYPAGSANINQPFWGDAAAAAERAVKLAPRDPDALRLRAQIYTAVAFWARAEEAWNALFEVAGDADPASRLAMSDVQYNLGFAAYRRGDLEGAQRRFEAAARWAPNNARNVVWQARVLFERGDVSSSLPLWERAAQLNPNDARARYFADVSRKAATFGKDATAAFSRGLEAYDAGRLEDALAFFRTAAVASPTFVEAQRWLGRTALEAGQAPESVRAWQTVSQLEGVTPANKYFLDYAREVERFGSAAVRDYRAGYQRYTQGDRAGAARLFEAAVAASPEYQKAWSWLGRVRFETGDFQGAVDAYTRAVDLDPSDAAAAYQLRLARNKL